MQEIFPIESYDKKITLEYVKYELGKPRYEPDECRQLRLTYGRPFKVWLRLRKGEYIRNVVIPATVPYVFTGLRIAVGLAWLAIVAAEMLKADGGIGYFIWDAYNAGGDGSSSQIILAIVYVGLVGLALDRLVAWAGRRVARGSN